MELLTLFSATITKEEAETAKLKLAILKQNFSFRQFFDELLKTIDFSCHGTQDYLPNLETNQEFKYFYLFRKKFKGVPNNLPFFARISPLTLRRYFGSLSNREFSSMNCWIYSIPKRNCQT
jgi:hypothetical protein